MKRVNYVLMMLIFWAGEHGDSSHSEEVLFSLFSLRLECKPRTVEICGNMWKCWQLSSAGDANKLYAAASWGACFLAAPAGVCFDALGPAWPCAQCRYNMCRYMWDMSYVSISLCWWWSEENQANCILYTHWIGLWIWYELIIIGIVFI